jgi:hypothetical protein
MPARLDIRRIAYVIGTRSLAADLYRSLAAALRSPAVHVVGDRTPWGLFTSSLDAAIRKIADGPGAEPFRRLLVHRPAIEDDPANAADASEPVMSDAEYRTCLEFIYSHMVNRFKGELAELLALEPCAALLEDLKERGRLPANAELYWGDTIAERGRKAGGAGEPSAWTGFAKGADGLIAEKLGSSRRRQRLRIHAVVEIKSMRVGPKALRRQLAKHLDRLSGGLKLAGAEWRSDDIAPVRDASRGMLPLSILVRPSRWRLTREWTSVETPGGREVAFPPTPRPSQSTRTERLAPELRRITLSWSHEALEQAAYEMTFWYMAQVGAQVFAGDRLPRGWQDMSPERAGCNAIKAALYYILLRPLDPRRLRLATRLYNTYCFGYQVGKDSRVMRWPGDFPYPRNKSATPSMSGAT